MAADDLGTPLGRKPRKPAWQWPAQAVPVAGGVLALFTAIFIWMSFGGNPQGGEPFAVAEIENAGAKPKNAAPPPVADPAPKAESAPKVPPGSQTVTIIDGKSGVRQEVIIKKIDPAASGVGADASPALPVDARLVETSRFGPIPRVASDGARPLDVYASAGAQAADRRTARIAVVIGGLGISGATTGDAIAKLPDSITLAFAPYGGDLQRWAARARGTGHEILLQLPMEPFDYPDNDPGPQTLLANAPAEQNLDRLYWMLSRLQGYIGVSSYMGARFTANDKALAPILRDIGKRGLLYLDDGSSPRSVAAQTANDAKIPFLRADVVIDAAPNWADIDSALTRLETIAADQGFAVGTATALPVSIERIARWAKAAQARGIKIVPLSAILPKAKQS